MRIRIHARGRIGQGAEADLVERYKKRIGWKVDIFERPDHDQKPLPPRVGDEKRILLDERGDNLGSAQLAARIGAWQAAGVRDISFAIGGADGFSDADRADADMLLSFGALTWPHLMARAMLLEQIYRVQSILAGHPYHREG